MKVSGQIPLARLRNRVFCEINLQSNGVSDVNVASFVFAKETV